MSEREPPKRLDDLTARISRARQSGQTLHDKAGQPHGASKSAFGQALRVGVEMAAALGVGFFIGWLLDNWLGTSPWLKIVFLLMGAAAGVLNVYRLASGFGYAAGYRHPEKTPITTEDTTTKD
ncbi:MAG: AtpZ/AtpI family protein [Rhodospirillales bacterium]